MSAVLFCNADGEFMLKWRPDCDLSRLIFGRTFTCSNSPLNANSMFRRRQRQRCGREQGELLGKLSRPAVVQLPSGSSHPHHVMMVTRSIGRLNAVETATTSNSLVVHLTS